MLAVKILDIKKCMQLMLTTEAFDFFHLAETKIITKVSCVIDGHITPDYFSEEELAEQGLQGESCVLYGGIRPLCYEMIKGKRTPKSFRFTFLCPRNVVEQMIAENDLAMQPQDVANLTLNVHYADEHLTVTTSCTLHHFSLDKAVENAWDQWVLDFFRRMEIATDKMT